MTEVRTQTPLAVLNAGEDRKWLATTGTNTCVGGGDHDDDVSNESFFDSEHSNVVVQALNELRVAGQLIDVVLVDAAGKKAKAHRAVVAAVCSEFENLLNGSPSAAAAKASSVSKPLEMQLKVLHPALEPLTTGEAESLLQFIYTGQVDNIRHDRVPSMLVLCHMMGVRGRLTESMRARIDPKMAAELFHLCAGRPKATKDRRELVWDGSGDPEPISPSLAGLLKLAESLLTRSFSQATDATESLLLMDERTLMWLIRQDSLHVRDEAEVFQAVLNWAEAQPSSKTEKSRTSSLNMKGVFSEVRFGYMSSESISKAFWRLSCIVGVTKIDANVQNIMAAATADSPNALTAPAPALEKPPRPYYAHRHRVVVVGGCLEPSWEASAQPVSNQMMMWMAHSPAWEGGQVGGGEPHGGGVGGWVRGPGMILARKFTGCACVNADSLFVVGGQSVSWDGVTVRRERLSSAEAFRVTLEQPRNLEVAAPPVVSPWGDEPAMLEVRSGLGVAALNGFVYAVGGNDGEKRLRSGERLDCAAGGTRQWVSLPHMKYTRSNLGLVVLAGKLYALGGYDGAGRLRSVEAYDPCLNKWSSCADMHTAREGFGCAVVDMAGGGQCIMAVGGFDGNRVLRSAERYDPVQDRWVLLPAVLQHPRAFLGLVSLQGLVFALGGQDDSGAMLASVEVYGTAQQLADAAIPVSSATPRGKGQAMHSSGNKFVMGAGNGLPGGLNGRAGSARSFDGAVVEEGAPFWALYEAMRLPAPMCNFAACIV